MKVELITTKALVKALRADKKLVAFLGLLRDASDEQESSACLGALEGSQ